MRTSRLDRVWREHWAVHALSPVVTADVGELRARFAEFMEANPADPLSCILSDDATRWLPVPAAQREVHATQVIVDGIDLDDTPDPYAVLPAHRPPTGYRPPFRMVVGRRSILFYVNHVIGDVMVITQLTSQLAQGNFVGLIAGARFGVPLLVKMTATQSLVHGRGWMRHRRPAAARRWCRRRWPAPRRPRWRGPPGWSAAAARAASRRRRSADDDRPRLGRRPLHDRPG